MCYSYTNSVGNDCHLRSVWVRTNSERLLDWSVLPQVEKDRPPIVVNTPYVFSDTLRQCFSTAGPREILLEFVISVF